MPLKPFFLIGKMMRNNWLRENFPFFQNLSFGGAQGLFKVQAKLGAPPRNDFITLVIDGVQMFM